MNLNVCFLFVILSFAKSISFAQTAQFPSISYPERSVASLMRYEEMPVGNYNGIPDITIPIFNVPTRSKDLNLDISLNYHPSSTAYNESSGDCGIGWSMFTGGAISRTIIHEPDEYAYSKGRDENNDIYQFNFMGHYGRFYIKKENGQMNLRILENKNNKLVIVPTYNPTTFVINSFVIYDDKGYKFLFEESDVQTYGEPYSASYKSTFHLTKVFDNNGIILLSYEYRQYSYILNVAYTNVYKKVKKILIDGQGSVNVNYNNVLPEYQEGTKLSSLELKDSKENLIKKFSLSFEGGGNQLTKTKMTGSDESSPEIHKYLYNSDVDTSNESFGIDEYGFVSYFPKCLYRYPYENITDNISMYVYNSGVLNEIVFPTGGSIQYNFESNTHSIYKKDADGIWQLNNNLEYGLESPENITVHTPYFYEFLGSGVNTYTFTIPTNQVPQNYYLQAIGTVYGNSDILPGTIIPEGPIGPYHLPTIYLKDGNITTEIDQRLNSQNACLGFDIYLMPGKTYTFTINALGNNNKKGIIRISSYTENAVVNRTNYGGGLRIKSVAIKEGSSSPVRQINYNYNFFDKPTVSSGVIVKSLFDEVSNTIIKRAPVGYKNVTVEEAGKGKTMYTYSTPLDFESTQSTNPLQAIYYDYKRGLLLKKEIVDQSDKLLTQELFTYDYVETPNSTVFFDNPGLNERIGWSKLSQKRSFFYTNSLSNPRKITENFIYDDEIRRVISHSTDLQSNVIKVEYTYHNGNSIFSQNRISKIESTKQYSGSQLTKYNKTVYSNHWLLNNNVVNQSFLPKTFQNAIGEAQLENSQAVMLYDEFSNVLESKTENGISTSYIYGYNKSIIVAVINNVSYTTIDTNIINNIHNTSTSGTEQQLLSALQALRNSLPTSFITTYTYIPLIGISTSIDVKNDKTSYFYDTMGRLKSIKDNSGYIITEKEYNLIPQN